MCRNISMEHSIGRWRGVTIWIKNILDFICHSPFANLFLCTILLPVKSLLFPLMHRTSPTIIFSLLSYLPVISSLINFLNIDHALSRLLSELTAGRKRWVLFPPKTPKATAKGMSVNTLLSPHLCEPLSVCLFSAFSYYILYLFVLKYIRVSYHLPLLLFIQYSGVFHSYL